MVVAVAAGVAMEALRSSLATRINSCSSLTGLGQIVRTPSPMARQWPCWHRLGKKLGRAGGEFLILQAGRGPNGPYGAVKRTSNTAPGGPSMERLPCTWPTSDLTNFTPSPLPCEGAESWANPRPTSERQLSFDALLENMTEGFAMCEAIWDVKGRLADYTILELNPALQRMLGVDQRVRHPGAQFLQIGGDRSPSEPLTLGLILGKVPSPSVGPEAVGTKLSDSAGDRTDWLRLCERVLKTGEPASFEVHTREGDRWHEIRITRVTETRMAQLFFDITDRKRAEARQADLFDELNHRVNNNLALVSGILRMKARGTAEASDAQEERIARFSGTSKCGSLSTSRGWAKPTAGRSHRSSAASRPWN